MDAFVMFAATSEPTFWTETVGWTWSICSVAIGLGFVIFVHELGHFLVAKACGVKCEKFYIGFDLFNLRFCRFQWGETEYGIGALPLGGYVKMLGQDDDPRHAMAEAERVKVLKEGTAAEGLTPGETVEQPQKYELDPRSYPAKPVLARMAIISAGVTMNVIFGAVLGAWAFWLGVEEMPALVGSTVPGGPAWTANLRPGMKFVQIGSGAEYEHYRFIDIKQHIILNGDDRKLSFTVRTRDGEEKHFALQPTSRAVAETKFPTIGYLQPESSVIMERVEHLKPDSSIPLEAGDRIVEINGVPLKTGKEGHEEFDYRLNAELARTASEQIRVVIERKAKDDKGKDLPAERHEVTIEPKPQRVVGLVMEIGPIVAVREGSPAQKAGFQAGDLIQEVNGQPVGDPLSLGQRLIPKDDAESWTFVVARQGADGAVTTRSITVTPEVPDQYFEDYRTGGPASIESIGVAVQVTNKVAAVEPGSSAEKEGFRPGDVLTKVKFVPADAADEEKEKELLAKEAHDEIVLDNDVHSWTRIHFRMQLVLPKTRLQVTAQRGKTEVVKTLTADAADSFYSESRGLVFGPVTVTHTAGSPGEALYLGVREIKEGMTHVVFTVSALLTGRVSAENMSGPIGILGAAGRIARSGLPELLIFLTFLSANLAVLNILPIPVLDGGHLLFLAWEGITRKPVNPNVQGYLSLVGLLLLLLLMIYATKNDIVRWVS
ncbi:MAG TPA: site-2 protease family protein [Pirellulaceae bacterium]|nr:site-2 protease family protein [Pirellulaceae bacterium]